MIKQIQLYLALLFLVFSQQVDASPVLSFRSFANDYLVKNSDILQAKRDLSAADRQKVQRMDQWRSRLSATPKLSFEEQSFGNLPNPISNRVSDINAQFTQSMPTGTSIELNGQKFLELANPIGQALDRRYSATITQDLFRNAFGKSQSAESNQGIADFEAAQLRYRRTIANSCEQAFTLYTETYVQQEIVALLRQQFEDAKRAVRISRQLYRDKLINQVDQLTSENDFLATQLDVQQAELRLENSKRQIRGFLAEPSDALFSLQDPSTFIESQPLPNNEKTLTEVIVSQQIESQDFALERARSERWTDIQLGLEVGETIGRTSFTGSVASFQEEYLRASVTFGFDLVNNTENAELKNAIYQKNSLVKEQQVLQQTQKMRLESLRAMDALLTSQVSSSAKQVRLLEKKMKIAFGQMKRARLDFQNYLLHRNAYLNQEQNFLNLKKDLWLNQFALQKEFAHINPKFCEVST